MGSQGSRRREGETWAINTIKLRRLAVWVASRTGSTKHHRHIFAELVIAADCGTWIYYLNIPRTWSAVLSLCTCPRSLDTRGTRLICRTRTTTNTLNTRDVCCGFAGLYPVPCTLGRWSSSCERHCRQSTLVWPSYSVLLKNIYIGHSGASP